MCLSSKASDGVTQSTVLQSLPRMLRAFYGVDDCSSRVQVEDGIHKRLHLHYDFLYTRETSEQLFLTSYHLLLKRSTNLQKKNKMVFHWRNFDVCHGNEQNRLPPNVAFFPTSLCRTCKNISCSQRTSLVCRSSNRKT